MAVVWVLKNVLLVVVWNLKFEISPNEGRGIMKIRVILLTFAAILLLAGLAAAEVVQYKLPVPGVVWPSTAARARRAVEPMEGVSEVKADASSHMVSVTFEDTASNLESITQALNDVGYTVGEPELLSE
jgi:copper chaperone CopZ